AWPARSRSRRVDPTEGFASPVGALAKGATSASFMAGPPSGERGGRWGGDDVARPGVDANRYGRRFPVGGVAGPRRAARGTGVGARPRPRAAPREIVKGRGVDSGGGTLVRLSMGLGHRSEDRIPVMLVCGSVGGLAGWYFVSRHAKKIAARRKDTRTIQ